MKRALLLTGMLMLVIFSSGWAQQKKVSGTVKDTKGNPVPVATIQIVGTTTGTTADANGNFVITASIGQELKISSIGYVTQTIKVPQGDEPINIALEPNANVLNEMVVTALGIKRSKRSVGYSVQQVGGAEIARSDAPNVVNALAGKVASVNISTPNGVEGGSTRIVIDGNNSLTGNNQPLIIVDGVPMENNIPQDAQSTNAPRDWGSPINLINSYDVQSINVLKGPAAAALYGGRGANGVIIITTKKGAKREGLGVDYTFSYKVIQPYRFLKMQNEYGTGGMVSTNGPVYQKDNNGKPRLTDGWTQLFVDPVTGSGPNGEASYSQVGWPGSGSSWGPKLDGTMITWWDGTQRPDNPQPDNMQLLYRNGTQATHTVSVSGGNDWGTLRAAYTRLDNTSILPNSYFKQNTFNIGSNIQLSPKMHLTLSASYYVNTYKNAPQLGNSDASSWQKRLLYNVGRDYKGLDVKGMYKNPDGTRNSLTGFPWVGNGGYVVWNILENNEWQTRRKLLGSAQFDYSATSFLDLMFRAGVDANNNETETKNPPIDNSGINDGYYGHGLGRDNTTDFVGMATFHKANIAKTNINAKLSIGAEAWQRQVYSISGYNDNWSAPIYSFGTYNGTPHPTSEGTINQKLNSLYGLLNLSYKNFLYLDITGRNDWSSALPPGQWSYFFPSVSASFIFSDALHINPDVLSFGKLRAAWAQAAVPPDPYLVNYTYSVGSFAGQLSTSLPGSLPALNYKPQINTTEDVGLTLGFLHDRLTLDLRYYHGLAKNQILTSPLPITSGVSGMYVSEGVLENSGMEFTIDAKIIDKPAIKWDIALHASHTNNKLISLPPGAQKVDLGSVWGDGGAHGPDISVKVGEQYGTIYGYDYTYYNNIHTPENRILIKEPWGKPEMNGTLYQTTGKLVPIGNSNPKIIFGITNTLTFSKGLSLSFLIDGKLGGDVWSGTYATMMQQGQAPETLKERDGGGLAFTTPDGKKTNWGVILPGKFPDGTQNNNVVMYYYKYMQYGVWSSTNIPTGSVSVPGSDWLDVNSVFKDNWIKMQEIDINYNLPDKLVRKTRVFQAASISLVGRDLFYLYSALPDNINPEGMNGAGNAQGIEFASLPSYRSLGFQIRLSF